MPTSSITKDFVVKDYDAYLQLLKDIEQKDEKCKECGYLDVCTLLETPSDEACEAIITCIKNFSIRKTCDRGDKYE